MKLFVGSLPPTFSEDDLRELFTKIATPKSVRLIIARDTGRSKCFGFVEFETKEDGERGIKEFNGKVIGTRPIVVNEAIPQENKPERSGPRGGGNGGPFKRRPQY